MRLRRIVLTKLEYLEGILVIEVFFGLSLLIGGISGLIVTMIVSMTTEEGDIGANFGH